MKNRKLPPPAPLEFPPDRAPSREELYSHLRNLVRNGNICLAYRIASNLMESDRGCPEWLAILGAIYLRAGALESARNVLQQALQIDGGNSEIHFHLAQVFAEEGRLEQARHHLQTAIDLQPDFSQYREWMAELNTLLSPSLPDSQETKVK